MGIEMRTRTEGSGDAVVQPRARPTIARDARRSVVLVVEDDPEDRDLIRRAFDDCVNDVNPRFVEDGEEAYDYLFGFGRYGAGGTRRPALILLDLNVPKKRGEALLREVRSDPVLRTIPVVIFTGSDNEADVRHTYDLGANTYFKKPSTIDGYRKVIRIIEAYWLRRAELP